MAGGFLILGQAVASADDASVSGSNNAAAGNAATSSADASNANSSSTEGGGGGGDYSDGGNASTDVDQDADANNYVDNTASTGDIDANGGTSYVVVFAGNGNSAGAGSEEGDASASQTVHNEVNVASHGGDATVSDSNNAAAGNGASYNADASNSNHSETTGGEGGEDGDGGNAYTDVDQDADATNDVENDADTGDIDADGGDSVVVVVAGNGNEAGAESGDKGDTDSEQVIRNEVGIVSRGGNAGVHGSNNAAAGNGGRYDADAHNENASTTSGGAGGDDGDGGYADTDVDQDSDAENDVDNNASTGDIDVNGGDSIIKVIVGNDNTLSCYSEEGDVDCDQHITNIINIISVGGNAGVTCSNNAAAGGSGQWVCHQPVTHEKPAAPAHQAAPAQHHKAAAPVHHRAAPMNTHAQPKGELAYTGAETTAPLALGLIALGAGGALTLAGRRRTASAAI